MSRARSNVANFAWNTPGRPNGGSGATGATGPAGPTGATGPSSIVVTDNSAGIGGPFTAINTQGTGFEASASGATANIFLQTPLAIGTGCVASGIFSKAIGFGCLAQGAYSNAVGNGCVTSVAANAATAMGDSCNVTQPMGAAFGDHCIVNGVAGTAFGAGCVAGHFCIAGGFNCQATNLIDVAFGNQCVASGGGSFAAGQFSQATNTTAVAMGLSCIASGLASVAFGNGSHAVTDYSVATGQSISRYYGERVHASAFFAVPGDCQIGDLILMGQTPGAGIGESAQLLIGNTEVFFLDDGFAYGLDVTCTAIGHIGGVQVCQFFTQKYVCRQAAGVPIIAGVDPDNRQFGDAGAASWTLVAGVIGADIVFTFSTGVTQAACNVDCRIDKTKVGA